MKKRAMSGFTIFMVVYLREKKSTPFDDEVQINIGDLPKGLLLVEWRGEAGRFVRKIVLE